MPRPFQIFSRSDYLIRIIDINSHTEWQTVQIQISWLLRSQLIWIYIVCKGRVYPGSAGQGLIIQENIFRLLMSLSVFNEHTQHRFSWRNKKNISEYLSYLQFWTAQADLVCAICVWDDVSLWLSQFLC